ncbi:sulfatase-like hydrolase/transferase [Halosquirtibacter xylanolyticus]|uniref:sulfatase-like hydrolase/transferase n=1 Tax=Halosquirtibacter xylanolyticus TaxID=3374599 RepID=UPI003748D4A7|nr:sulfatase-like hydrolase/transferase [Prolixibacteraceae bacterium]
MSWKSTLKRGFIFFLLNSILCLLISTRYLINTDISSLSTSIYLIISTIGHYFGIILLLYTIVYIPLSLLYKLPKLLNSILIILFSSLTTLLIVDTFVFQLYRFHINNFIIGLILGEGAGDIFQIGTNTYLLGLLSISLIIALESLFVFLSKKWLHIFSIRKVKTITLSGLLICLLYNGIYAYSDAVVFRPVLKLKVVYPLSFPLTAKSFIYKYIVDETTINTSPKITIQENKSLNYPKQKLTTQSSKMNILVLMIDAWNYQCMTPQITPNINSFAKENQLFLKHFSGSNMTKGGVFSFFYGIPALYWEDMIANQTAPVLFDVLKKHNYDIQLFPSATLRNPSLNLNVFSSLKDPNLSTQGENPNVKDANITKNFIQYIKTRKDTTSPFFSFVFYDSAHAINHPKDYKGPFQPEWEYPKYELLSNNLDPIPFFNLYKNSVHYVDHLIKGVFDIIKENNLLENTIVIITGDHGQEFNENHKNYWGHNGNFSKYQTQVPLIIHFPGETAKVMNHLTTHYDITPTILQKYFQCKTPIKSYSVGKNIYDKSAREPIVMGTETKFAFREKDRITYINDDRTFEITDLDLNPLDDAPIHAKSINQSMKIINQYYQ